MRAALLSEIITDGEPGLSATNDHDLDLLRHACVFSCLANARL
jgi:hypothetical protein